MQTNQSLLFVGGDLSGIQKFIYNVSSKKAAVSLKGRSRHLVDYTRELSDGLLRLPAVHAEGSEKCIYCSGGKFYLITGDTPAIREAIEDYAREEERKLWEKHCGQLGLSICYLPFRFVDSNEQRVAVCDEEGSIGLLWKYMTLLFTDKKNRKFEHVLTDAYDSLFEVQEVGGDVKVCAITGLESKECVKLDRDDDGEEIWVLPSVKEQVELGQQLRRKEGFKTFEDYAGKSYLGVLRMDVDGLGGRFQKGFANMAEYSAFSKKLKQFFEDEVWDLRARREYKEHLNIIYAGGDDLFAVGRWDKIIEFAASVREAFCRKMQGEANMSISGGIAVVGAKFPIAKAAELSGDAEKLAKDYVAANGKQKNAISFLGETVGWDDEFAEVRSLKDELMHQITDNGLGRGILHKLMSYAAIAKAGKDMKYMWHSVYYLTRMMGRCPKEARPFVAELRDKHITRGDRHFQLLALAARWAELELRIEQ